MNTTRRLALGALFAGLLSACGTTAPPAAPVPPEVRSALAPTGTLRIAVYPGSPTSLVRGPGPGEMRGLAVELGRELARRLGVPAEVLVFERLTEVIDALKTARADFTVSNASPARARDAFYTAPVVTVETGYLVAAGSALQRSAEVDRDGLRVGVTQGSSSQAALGMLLKQARVLAAPTVAAATEMLRKGELDAFATNKGILFEMSDRLPGSRVLDGRWGLEHLAVAVPHGREVASAWLQAFVSDVAGGGLVQQAAARAGLRGLAAPGTR